MYVRVSHLHIHSHCRTHLFLGTQKCIGSLSNFVTFEQARHSEPSSVWAKLSQVSSEFQQVFRIPFYVFGFLFWFLFLFSRRFVRSYKIKFAWFKLKNTVAVTVTVRCGSINNNNNHIMQHQKLALAMPHSGPQADQAGQVADVATVPAAVPEARILRCLLLLPLIGVCYFHFH